MARAHASYLNGITVSDRGRIPRHHLVVDAPKRDTSSLCATRTGQPRSPTSRHCWPDCTLRSRSSSPRRSQESTPGWLRSPRWWPARAPGFLPLLALGGCGQSRRLAGLAHAILDLRAARRRRYRGRHVPERLEQGRVQAHPPPPASGCVAGAQLAAGVPASAERDVVPAAALAHELHRSWNRWTRHLPPWWRALYN
jgi:hypothetical protein